MKIRRVKKDRHDLKSRLNITLSNSTIQELGVLSDSLGMSKSAYIEEILQESLKTTKLLFNPDLPFSQAIVNLATELNEIKELLQKDDNLKRNVDGRLFSRQRELQE